MKIIGKLAVCLVSTLLVFTVVVAGCQKSSTSSGTANGTSPVETRERYPDSGDDTFVNGDEGKTPEEKEVAEEALNYVHDVNIGSTFKVIDVKTIDGWARVAVEEVGIPVDEAVSFNVYLRKLGGGEWEMVEAGTELTPEDIPGAPPEIFEQ